jgi:hypothetical protein
MSFDFKRMIKFEHNVGEKEKKYRLYGGAALIAISIFTASIALLLIGMALVATGFSGFCPGYAGLGKNTCCTGHGSETVAPPETVDSVETSDKSEENN